MRLHVQHVLRLATGEIGLCFLLLALAVGIASIPADAQEDAWKVDEEHSIARLSLGFAPKAAEVGLARVSGDVVFETNDPGDPIVNLNLRPDKRAGADYSQIHFKSKRSAMTGDGHLAVVGDMLLTGVKRNVTLDPNEGYIGAAYGEPIVRTDAREVTLILPAEIRPALQNGTMQLSAFTNVSREYFPELLTALAAGNWSNVAVEDENCAIPTTIGEDYSGAICTGTLVTTATNGVAPASAGIGEGYYGFEQAVVPGGGQASLALNLKLTQVSSAPSASATAQTGN